MGCCCSIPIHRCDTLRDTLLIDRPCKGFGGVVMPQFREEAGVGVQPAGRSDQADRGKTIHIPSGHLSTSATTDVDFFYAQQPLAYTNDMLERETVWTRVRDRVPHRLEADFPPVSVQCIPTVNPDLLTGLLNNNVTRWSVVITRPPNIVSIHGLIASSTPAPGDIEEISIMSRSQLRAQRLIQMQQAKIVKFLFGAVECLDALLKRKFPEYEISVNGEGKVGRIEASPDVDCRKLDGHRYSGQFF